MSTKQNKIKQTSTRTPGLNFFVILQIGQRVDDGCFVRSFGLSRVDDGCFVHSFVRALKDSE